MIHDLAGEAERLGEFLKWLLADALSLHLHMGLSARRLSETEADKEDRLARRRKRQALENEARRAKEKRP